MKTEEIFEHSLHNTSEHTIVPEETTCVRKEQRERSSRCSDLKEEDFHWRQGKVLLHIGDTLLLEVSTGSEACLLQRKMGKKTLCTF